MNYRVGVYQIYTSDDFLNGRNMLSSVGVFLYSKLTSANELRDFGKPVLQDFNKVVGLFPVSFLLYFKGNSG